MKLQITGPKIDVWILANIDATPFVYMHRVIDTEQCQIYHSLMTFHPKYRGGGQAGKILGCAVDFYKELKLRRITLMAGLSGGGALWSKAGFLPFAGQEETVKQRVLSNLDHVSKNIKDRYKIKKGEELSASVEEIFPAMRSKWMWELRDLGGGDPSMKIAKISLGAALLMETRWEGYLDLTDVRAMARLDSYVAECMQKA